MASNIERDRENLSQAHSYKDQANEKYMTKDYGKAMMLYHRCLLHARGVAQLSSMNLQILARDQLDEKENGFIMSEQAVTLEKLIVDQSASQGPAAVEFVNTTGTRSRLDSTSRGEELREEARDLIAKCYNNLAACILAGDGRGPSDYMRASFYCDKVLDFDPKNEKAMFRKASAVMKVEQYEDAIDLFKKCDKGNSQAKIKIHQCQEKLREQRRKRDDKIRANFAKERQMEQQRNGEVPPGQPNGSAMNGSAVHEC